jgi:probable DNA metabolism protein
MSYRGNVIYLYDGSFEGVLSAIFDSYLYHENPISIERTENGQLSFDSEYRHIPTDTEKARRVADKIISCAGYNAYKHMYYTFLSEKPISEINIADYVKMCLKFGKAADKHLTVPCVDFVLDAAQRTGHEAHKYTGFIRFSELQGGIYYSEIEPVHNILPIIAFHFSKRYANMPFLIHDSKRKLCLVYDCKECVIRETDGLPKLNYSDDEEEYRSLWKEFYETIEIKERHNERCRMSLMPKRYWRHMTEFEK